MPTNYAHFRFGQECLQRMPDRTRLTARRFRNLFELGLHGPDLFFFYNPVMTTPTGKLGKTYHRSTGRAFFENAAGRQPSEAARAYLYGVLAHYCLDAACHPLVNQWVAEGKAVHTQIETELDRQLMVRDKKKQPQCCNVVSRLHLTRGERETVAWAYPPATAWGVGSSLRHMKVICWCLACPLTPVRKLAAALAGLAGPKGRGMVMGEGPDKACEWAVRPLMQRWHGALEAYPLMARQLQALLEQGTPLGEEFDEVFG